MLDISVSETDAFIKAIIDDADWDLKFGGVRYKTVSARMLWQLIMHSSCDYAEPGVIFIDPINKANNLNYCENIPATNPCVEQPLTTYGAFISGAINLSHPVKKASKPNVKLDMKPLGGPVTIAVFIMDNAKEVFNFSLKVQAEEAK